MGLGPSRPRSGAVVSAVGAVLRDRFKWWLLGGAWQTPGRWERGWRRVPGLVVPTSGDVWGLISLHPLAVAVAPSALAEGWCWEGAVGSEG